MQPLGLVSLRFCIRSRARCCELNCISLRNGVFGLTFYRESITAGCLCHDLDRLLGLGILVDVALADHLARPVKHRDACPETAGANLNLRVLAFAKFNLIALLLPTRDLPLGRFVWFE